jgi:hypothetical protein
MKRYEYVFDLLLKKYYGIKNKFFKKNIREGNENIEDEDSCDEGDVFNGKECLKEIKTIKMFALMPIANSLIIAIISFLFAGMLFKIKSSPLAVSKNGLSCNDIPLDMIFKKNSPLFGMVREDVYKDKASEYKYGKILFPWLDKNLYPTEGKPEGQPQFSTQFILMLPFFISLKICTTLWYKPISFIKKILYKQTDWGTIPEISKINKESWLKDLVTIFIFTPLLLFFVFPISFILSLITTTIISPIFTWAIYYLPNEKFTMYPEVDPEDDGRQKLWNIVKTFLWLPLFFICGLVYSIVIFGYTILWFGIIFFGAHEGKRDGLKTVFKTWANIIWDYKYIWALFAIAMWCANFETYLKGPHNIITFVNEKDRLMIPGIVIGAAVLLLGMQQMKFFQFLPKVPKYRSGCYPNCNPPAVSRDEAGLTKKCPPKSSKTIV